jgi:serine/threonine protein kinase
MSAAEVVIIDFGVAQRVGVERRAAIYGTPGYIAPEVWDTKVWCPEGDMFSFGVVVVQVLLGKENAKFGVFTENTKTFKEVKEATQKRLPPLELMPAEFPSLQWLAKHLLAKDSKDRPTASSLLSEPWGGEDEDSTKDRKLKRRHTVHAKKDAIDSDEDPMQRQESDRKSLRRHTTPLVEKTSCEGERRTIAFQPGAIGIGYSEGEVIAVHEGGQAQREGVQVGWRLVAIDDHSCTGFDDAIFEDASSGACAYRATFVKAKPLEVKALPNLLPKLGASSGSQRTPVKMPSSIAKAAGAAIHRSSIAALPGTASAVTSPFTPRTIGSPAKPALPLLTPRVIVGAQLAR